LPSSIVDFYPDPTLVIDTDGKVMAWNKAMEDLTGFKEEDVIGKGNYEYALPFYGERVPILVDMLDWPEAKIRDYYVGATFNDGKLEAMTIMATLKGRNVVLWGTASKLLGINGKPIGAIECIRDVTALRHMEETLHRQNKKLEQWNERLKSQQAELSRVYEQLKESEEKYRLITNSTSDGLVAVDLSGIISYINPSIIEMIGLGPEFIIGRHFTDFIAEEYVDIAKEAFERGVSGSDISSFEIEGINGKGERIPLEISGGALNDSRGRILGAIVNLRSVSDRKKAREALKNAHDELERRVEERTAELTKARSMLQTVLDTIPAGIIVADAETGQIVYSNQGASRVFSPRMIGNSPYSGHDTYTLNRPDGSPIKPANSPLNRSLRRGEYVYDEELLVRHSDSSDISALISSAPVLDSGRIVGAVASVIDITERKLMESALRESEEKFRVLTETTSSAILIHRDGRFIYVNTAAERVSGFSKKEMMAVDFRNWIMPEFREMVYDYYQRRILGQQAPLRYEIKFINRKREERWAEITPGLIEYRSKPAVLVTAVDITDRKNAERSLEEAKKRAELYLDLMGHDINNMNQVAMGYLEMARNTTSKESEAAVFMDRSMAMLEESSRLVDNVRKIQQAVGGSLKLETVDMDAIIKKVRAEYSIVPGRDVTIRYRSAKGCAVVANQLLKDVFSNIVSNAIKHSMGPLKIVISVRRHKKGQYTFYQVSIEDDGPGIPDELKDAVFSRMKRGTTKAKGSGLGLYLVKTLVEGFHGEVRVEDRVAGDSKKGCRFIVTLPAA